MPGNASETIFLVHGVLALLWRFGTVDQEGTRASVSDTFQDVTLKGNQGFGGYKLVLLQIQPKFQIFEIWYVPRQYQKFIVADREILTLRQLEWLRASFP